MIPAARFRVAGLKIAVVVGLAGQLEVGQERIGVDVGINEVLAGVVRWVNVDQLLAAEVRLEQQLQHF
ncbi:MAG: hypothetical protein KatS3mg113_0811 [Planctomycetaceae bacterium]|nr:MAG: hypothetical protein KatS3mg113_0811 [Planctomycetaceae bacterium]